MCPQDVLGSLRAHPEETQTFLCSLRRSVLIVRLTGEEIPQLINKATSSASVEPFADRWASRPADWGEKPVLLKTAPSARLTAHMEGTEEEEEEEKEGQEEEVSALLQA